MAFIWAAMMLLVMLGIVGLSLDMGKLTLNVHQLQNAADGGALAGAQLIKYNRTGAIQLAHDIAQLNYADGSPVTPDMTAQTDPLAGTEEIIVGRWVSQERRFYPTLLSPNAIKVIGKRQDGLGTRAPALSLVFGPIFGTHKVNADRFATAWSRVSSGSGIIVLTEDPTVYPKSDWKWGSAGLYIDGNVTLDLSGTDLITGEPLLGDIQVNAGTGLASSPPGLVKKGGSGEIVAGEINVHGQVSPNESSPVWQSPSAGAVPISVNPLADVVPDPLAALNNSPPNIKTMAVGTDSTGKVYGVNDTITGGTLTLNEGYYAGGINLNGGNITLNPGVYAFGGGNGGGAGFCVKNGGVTGTGGVEIYVTGDPTGSKTGVKTAYGTIDIASNGLVQLISPGDVSPTDDIPVDGEPGVVLWQDESNHNLVSFGQGNPNSFVTGTIYVPNAPVSMGGTPGQWTCQIICGALWVHGNVSISVGYDGRNMIFARRSILVE